MWRFLALSSCSLHETSEAYLLKKVEQRDVLRGDRKLGGWKKKEQEKGGGSRIE